MSVKTPAEQRFQSSRRSFVKAIGRGALALPVFRLLERSALGDPPSGPPQRLILVYSPHGRAMELWRPQAGFTIDPLSELQVFDDAATYGVNLKSKLTVVDGLDVKCGYELYGAIGDKASAFGHNATSCLWTGSNPRHDGSLLPQCASIDYTLAIKNGLGSATQFPLVVSGVDHSMAPAAAKCYGPNGTPQALYTRPTDLYMALFGNFMSTTSSNQAAADLLARKKSVLDYARGSISTLQARLGTTEKAKLDQHLTALREIENRLSAPPTSQTCMAPAVPVPCDPNKETDDKCIADPTLCYCEDPNYNFPQFSSYSNDSSFAILTEALLCDLTRFVNVEIEDSSLPLTDVPAPCPPVPGNSQFGSHYQYASSYPSWYANGGGEQCTGGDCVHNDVAHMYRQSDNFTLSTDMAMRTSQIRLSRAKKYHMSKIATLAASLDGAGLLDSSLIVSTSEVADPAGHDSLFMPFIMLGSANGYFKTGQHVIMPNDKVSPGYKDKFDSSTDPYFDRQNSHNALLVMICNAFGAGITDYGVSANPNPSLTTQGSAALQQALAALKA